MLDPRINTFISVCNNMSYTKAAKELNLTQPAVSQHIRYLENLYGVRLFKYEKKQLSLTEEGKLLQSIGYTLKSDEELLKRKIREIGKEQTEHHIGATMTVGEYGLIRPIAQFLQNHPNTKMELTIANTEELLKKLKNKEIDFAIMEGYFPKEQYDYIVFSTERYIPICSASNPVVAKGKDIMVKDLAGQRLIVRERGSGTRDIMEKNLQGHGIEIDDFEYQMEVNSLHAIVQLAKEDCGITFLYEIAAKEEIEKGTIKEIGIKDFLVEHNFTFLWNKGSAYERDYRSICNELSGYSLDKSGQLV